MNSYCPSSHRVGSQKTFSRLGTNFQILFMFLFKEYAAIKVSHIFDIHEVWLQNQPSLLIFNNNLQKSNFYMLLMCMLGECGSLERESSNS